MPAQKVMLFDGVCNLCSGMVQFVIKRDPKRRFRFASLQSKFGQQKLEELGYSKEKFSSFILLDGDKVFRRSTAALKLFKELSGAWPLMYVFIVFPVSVRDWVYTLIANNRYKLFGQKNQCWMPSEDLRSRFID